MGEHAQCSRKPLQTEYVPLILLQLSKLMLESLTQEAISLLDALSLTNELFKEHLMELCMSREICQLFDKLTTQ
jgi:hypothetical protein